MADDKHPEIVIIRRPLDHGEEGHHGGAWKIAYADFMTAMMAFFLVMWLINSTSKDTRASVARYFNPVKLADATMSKKGLNDPVEHKDTPADPDTQENGPNAAAPPTAAKTGDASKPVADPKLPPTDRSAVAPVANAVATDAPAPTPHYSDAQLFRDPYAVLAEIAGGPGKGPQAQDQRPPSTNAGNGQSGLTGGDAFRDPFSPMTRTLPPDAKVDPNADLLQADASPPPAAAATPPASSPAAAAPAEPNPRQPAAAKAAAAKAAGALHLLAAAAVQAARLRADLSRVVAQEGGADKAKSPDFDVQSTDDGLLISLTDAANFGMFAIGSAEPQPQVVRIMSDIAGLLKNMPGSIVIRGFTDGRPFKGGASDNWRLSADRAQMAHYMLVRGGLDEKRIERIEGWADRQLKVPSDPGAAENRRIEILVRKPKP